MLDSHNMLQKYFYKDKDTFNKLTVGFIDRGAPEDTSWIAGIDIKSLDSYYFVIGTGDNEKYIPYHRILLIKLNDNILFQNNKYNGW
jgi:uncharacterized protein (UPF0248 family)